MVAFEGQSWRGSDAVQYGSRTGGGALTGSFFLCLYVAWCLSWFVPLCDGLYVTWCLCRFASGSIGRSMRSAHGASVCCRYAAGCYVSGYLVRRGASLRSASLWRLSSLRCRRSTMQPCGIRLAALRKKWA